MSESSDQDKNKQAAVDLSGLQDFSFGPDWSSKSSKPHSKRSAPSSKDKPKGHGNVRRDRRPARPPRDFRSEGGSGRDSGGQQQSQGFRRSGAGRFDKRSRGDARSAAPFRPTVDALFYPEDVPFRALSQAIKTSCRTYELFEIAKLILEKNERHVVVVKRKAKSDSTQDPFYVSLPDGLPFETEDEAVAHVLKNHLDKFFNIEEVEVEPPKGAFQSVNKCGFTGELLGPPNFHRYQALLKEHHATHLPSVSFEKFSARIESVKEEEVVQQWVEKMTKVTRYTLKDATEGDNTVELDGLEAAKNYLVGRLKAKVVRTTDQARVSGKLVETMPNGNLRRSIETSLEMQRRFPLDTANNLRGRLRRMKFTIYKKGSKGVSFVCAVKRKFRTPETRFAESIQQLIDFIEAHPNVAVGDLAKEFLGIDHEIKGTPASPAPEIKEESEAAPTSEESGSSEKTDEPGVESESEKPSAAVVVDETSSELTADEAKRIKQMMLDLRWLVTEGYVSEFADTKLFAPLPLTKPQEEGSSDRGESESESEAQSKLPSTPVENPSSSEAPEQSDAVVSVSAVEEAQAETSDPSDQTEGEAEVEAAAQAEENKKSSEGETQEPEKSNA